MDTKEAKYIAYIKSKYPEMELIKTESNFTDGKHGDIVIVNDKHVFKFSRFDWSVGYIDNEVNILKLLSRYLSTAIPEAEGLEKGVARFSLIKGEPLYRNTILQLRIRLQEMLAEQLGTFLRQLHSTSLKGANTKSIQEYQNTRSFEEWLVVFEEIERKVFLYCDSFTKEYYRQIFKPLLSEESFMSYQPTLIHGDLMPYHIIYNKSSNRISGIIDFGLAGIGDPAVDIGAVLDNYGEAFVRRMSRYYKNIELYIDRARFYSYMGQLLWYKSLTDMIATRDFSNLRVVARDRDIMPIGTKWLEVK